MPLAVLEDWWDIVPVIVISPVELFLNIFTFNIQNFILFFCQSLRILFGSLLFTLFLG